MTQQAPKAPEKTYRAGCVSATIWQNEVERDGRIVTQYSVKIEKHYKDQKTDEWRSSDYYYGIDLADLVLVARLAYQYIRLRQSESATGTTTAA
jgi:hypothetical protein